MAYHGDKKPRTLIESIDRKFDQSAQTAETADKAGENGKTCRNKKNRKMTLAVKKQEKCIPTFFAPLICLNTFVSELIKIWHIFAFLAAAAAAVRLGQVKTIEVVQSF